MSTSWLIQHSSIIACSNITSLEFQHYEHTAGQHKYTSSFRLVMIILTVFAINKAGAAAPPTLVYSVVIHHQEVDWSPGDIYSCAFQGIY